MRAMTLLFVGFSGLAGLGASCGGDDTSETTGGACFDYSTFDGATPAVSFSADVLPIFQQSCSLSTSCHGNVAGTNGRPYMGPIGQMTPTMEQVAEIFAQNVNVNAVAADMKIVAPGDPKASFMTHKIDGTLSSECGVTCASTGCGTPMPQATEFVPIDASKRDTIRRWIAQGAKND